MRYRLIVLPFLFLLCSLRLIAQDNAVSKPLYFRLPLEEYVRIYSETKLAEWIKWDRYAESTEQYRERVSEENQHRQIAKWEKEALAAYKMSYMETTRWDRFAVEGKYDPDNESVQIVSPLYGQFTVHVPKGETARIFVEQFDRITLSDPDFVFSGDQVGLRKLTFILPGGKQVVYDVQTAHPYSDLHDEWMNISVEPVDVDKVIRPAKQAGILAPDVDRDIPRTRMKNENVYVVIIGNENYFYESPTRFSANDAQTFYQYCIHALGVPERNITLKVDATYGEMLKSLQFLKDASRSKNGDVRILFYYSGHGMSDIKDNKMYLIPVDGSSMTLQAALKAEHLYKELSDMKALSATVFLDACFSGKSSEGTLAALVDGAGIEVTPREESLYGNLVVFSATSDTEIAYPYEEKKHRLFTYFLLKKLQNSRGNTTYYELADYLIRNVKSYAFDINKRTQTPKVQTSHDIREVWKSWKLVE